MLQLLDHLTEAQTEVIVLRALGDMTSRDIAEVTGRSIGAVEQLQHRAGLVLRAHLESS